MMECEICEQLFMESEQQYKYWQDSVDGNRILVDARKIEGLCAECCIVESKLSFEFSAKDEKIAANATCVVCNTIWVDVKNGYDTCKQCVNLV